jgi:hypothetical protein
VAEIPLLARDGSVKAYTYVEDEDLDRVTAAGPWHLSQGYVTKTIGLHRFVMMGTDLNNDAKVDHFDRDPLNNRRSNLRLVTDSENCQNRRSWGKSQHRGVTYDKRSDRWVARCRKDGEAFYLGRFDTAEEAGQATSAWREANFIICSEEM